MSGPDVASSKAALSRTVRVTAWPTEAPPQPSPASGPIGLRARVGLRPKSFENQRPEHVRNGEITWADYRPAHRSDAVHICHHKTGEKGWVPLEDEEGPLFPELESYLAQLPRLGHTGPWSLPAGTMPRPL